MSSTPSQPAQPQHEDEKECCSVCTESYNKSTRKKVSCSKCNANYCVTCLKAYLLGSSMLSHCLSCRVGWNDERLRDLLSNSWITKEYAPKRRDLMFEIEKAMLPGTMPLVEREHNKIRDKKEFANVDPVLKHVEFLLREVKRIRQRRDEPIGHTKVALDELKDTIRRIKFFEDKTPVELGATGVSSDGTKTSEAESRKFIKPCPEEKCNGFLSTQYKCGICACKTCPKCFEVIERGTHISSSSSSEEEKKEEHVCKPENIATADMIRNETKNCPSCGTNIFKISGCNMMFCTHCHTAFDWKSGALSKGPVHNPHFFEWLEQTGQRNTQIRPNENNPTGCLWTDQTINYTMLRRRLQTLTQEDRTIITNILQGVSHIADVDMRRLMNPLRTPEELNQDIRIEYLMNHISLTKLKQLCLKRQIQLDFDNAQRLLFEMMSQACRDIINTLQEGATKAEGMSIMKQLMSLTVYYNQQILGLYNKFKRQATFSYFEIQNNYRRNLLARTDLNPKRTRRVQSVASAPHESDSDSE